MFHQVLYTASGVYPMSNKDLLVLLNGSERITFFLRINLVSVQEVRNRDNGSLRMCANAVYKLNVLIRTHSWSNVNYKILQNITNWMFISLSL